jgi:hypothetical protein
MARIVLSVTGAEPVALAEAVLDVSPFKFIGIRRRLLMSLTPFYWACLELLRCDNLRPGNRIMQRIEP